MDEIRRNLASIRDENAAEEAERDPEFRDNIETVVRDKIQRMQEIRRELGEAV
jgi:hypothetical protein